MAYIFMDESGDLGFRKNAKKSSRYFVVAFLVVKDKKPFEKIIKKMHQQLSRRKHRRAKSDSFHATHEEGKTIKKVLQELIEVGDFEIRSAAIRKDKLSSKVKIDKHTLYNNTVKQLLDKMLGGKDVLSGEEIVFIASQRETSKHLNENFKRTVAHDFQNRYGILVKVQVKKPHEEKCLQLADLIVWSIFQKYKNGDESFCDIIKEFVVEEEFFP